MIEWRNPLLTWDTQKGMGVPFYSLPGCDRFDTKRAGVLGWIFAWACMMIQAAEGCSGRGIRAPLSLRMVELHTRSAKSCASISKLTSEDPRDLLDRLCESLRGLSWCDQILWSILHSMQIWLDWRCLKIELGLWIDCSLFSGWGSLCSQVCYFASMHHSCLASHVCLKFCTSQVSNTSILTPKHITILQVTCKRT